MYVYEFYKVFHWCLRPLIFFIHDKQVARFSFSGDFSVVNNKKLYFGSNASQNRCVGHRLIQNVMTCQTVVSASAILWPAPLRLKKSHQNVRFIFNVAEVTKMYMAQASTVSVRTWRCHLTQIHVVDKTHKLKCGCAQKLFAI